MNLHTSKITQLALVFSAAVSISSANLLTNGSFEDSTDFAGWTSSGIVQVQTDPGDLTTSNSNYKVGQSDGSRSVAFNWNGTGQNDGVITQTFATEVGVEYTVRFDYGLYGVSGSGVSADLRVQVTGSSSLYNVVYSDTTGSAGGYVLSTPAGSYSSYGFTFVANSATTTLSFSDAATSQMGGNDTALDNVSVTVSPPNTAPVLPSLSAQSAPALAPFTLVNTAVDDQAPPQTLTYELINPPAGASIDSGGVISWQPAFDQVGQTFTLETTVTDNGSPALSATNSVAVTVTAPPPPPHRRRQPPHRQPRLRDRRRLLRQRRLLLLRLDRRQLSLQRQRRRRRLRHRRLPRLQV